MARTTLERPLGSYVDNGWATDPRSVIYSIAWTIEENTTNRDIHQLHHDDDEALAEFLGKHPGFDSDDKAMFVTLTIGTLGDFPPDRIMVKLAADDAAVLVMSWLVPQREMAEHGPYPPLAAISGPTDDEIEEAFDSLGVVEHDGHPYPVWPEVGDYVIVDVALTTMESHTVLVIGRIIDDSQNWELANYVVLSHNEREMLIQLLAVPEFDKTPEVAK